MDEIDHKYKGKIDIIKKSNQKEYLNIYIENNSTSEKYNANFDFNYLKNKSFFSCLNLEIICMTLKLQLKNKKVKIINEANDINQIKLVITLDKENSPLTLIIPKFIENEQIDQDEILRLKTISVNLGFYNNNINSANESKDLRGFTNEIIKNREEADMLLKWIDREGTHLKVKRIYKPTKEKNSWKDFHEACDNKGPTIVLCEEFLGMRFGGFTKISWDMTNRGYADSSSFLFNLDKSKKYSGKNPGIHCGANYGPHFWGCLRIIDNDEDGEFIGKQDHLSLVENNNYYSVQRNELTGADKFTLKKMEVYQVKKI